MKDEVIMEVRVSQEMEEALKHLVLDYNKLADSYNNLVDDTDAVLKFLRDIARGLAIYGTGFLFSDDDIRNMKPISTLRINDSDRLFAIEMYNEIVGFLNKIMAGARPTEAFEEWMQECKKLAQGGIFYE